MSVKTIVRLSRIFVSLDLNALIFDALTVSWSSLFHRCFHFIREKYVVIYLHVAHRVLLKKTQFTIYNLYPSAINNSCEIVLEYPLHIILNNSIMSCLLLRSSEVDRSKPLVKTRAGKTRCLEKSFLGLLGFNVPRPDTNIMTQKFIYTHSPATSFIAMCRLQHKYKHN